MPLRKKIAQIRAGKRVRPPKRWFYEKLRLVKRYEDGIKTPKAVVGYIWHKLPRRKKIAIVRRYLRKK